MMLHLPVQGYLHPGMATLRRDIPFQEVELHGHRVGFRMAGSGPLVVLIHGITSRSDIWLDVMSDLAENYTVVAPDLGVLGFERGTVVGHSLGGGVALQFAYQFPEYCERLALISSGGLGKEVNPLLRAAALPGAELVLPLITSEFAIQLGSAVGAFLERFGFKAGPDLAEAARGYASLADRDARQAFLHTLRAVIDLNGQRVSATDRLYLAERMPTLLIWGTDDPIIPAAHGRTAHEQMPGSRLVEIPGAGHWPQLDHPRQVVAALNEFIETTEPYEFDQAHMREMLRRGPAGAGDHASARAPA